MRTDKMSGGKEPLNLVDQIAQMGLQNYLLAQAE